MKKNIIITILATSIILFTILAIVGMNMEDEVAPTPPTPTAIKITNTTQDVFRSNFMSGCNENGENYPYCTCAFNDLINQNGEDKLLKLSLQYAKDEIMPQEFIDSAKKCISLYNL